MEVVFKKYKGVESLLQKRVEVHGFDVSIESITSLDLFYTDGLAGKSDAKAVFTNKNEKHNDFTIFFPFLCARSNTPEELKKEFLEWMSEVKGLNILDA